MAARQIELIEWREMNSQERTALIREGFFFTPAAGKQHTIAGQAEERGILTGVKK